MVELSNEAILEYASRTAKDIYEYSKLFPDIKAYPIPRGGVPAAYAVKAVYPDKGHLQIVTDPDRAHIFIDDLIDSGATEKKWRIKYGKRLFVLIDKRSDATFRNKWILFPWEKGSEDTSINENIVRILQYIGEDPSREGLKETPKRVAAAWHEWTRGYKFKPEDVLKTFEDGADGVDEMVVQKDLPFYSHCEHHMAAIFGTATVAYIPDGKIVGLSKLARVVDIFARRLQVQERLTNQIADALNTHLKPKGVGVVVKARHLCMESRGVDKQGHETITSALRGVMRTSPAARAEFLDLAR